MSVKIVKNTTASNIDWTDVGITIPANSQVILQQDDFTEAADSEQIIDFVSAGTFVINDGNQDLNKAQGIALIQSGFVKTDLVDDLITNNRIKVDVSGDLSNGTLKVSSNDSTTAFLEDKIVSPNNKISITTLNDGSDEDVQITLNSGNINSSELNNDANFINSSQAPVQPSDIVNFETTTELNVRDTNNRNRANHTGTQTSSSISDFSSAVQASETTTTLSFNNTTKILTYVNEDGTSSNVDLTQFLDDTNLAQIVSGSLDAVTGIATFTRDDNTTFTVDFSSLNDQAAINTAINTHEQTINNHNDVDVITNPPTVNDVLTYNGTNWVPQSSRFRDFTSSTSGLINQLDSFEQYLSLNTSIPSSGNYKISWHYIWSVNTTGNDFISRVQVDNSTTIAEHQQEVKDSAGGGVTLPNTEGGTSNSSSNQRYNTSGFAVINLSAGSHTIDLDFRGEVFDIEPAIYTAYLTIESW